MKKIAFIFLLTANFGLPLNSWAAFVLLLLGGAIVLVGEVSSDRRLWSWAALVTASVIVLRFVIPSHAINEGHSVFDPSEKSALHSAMPAGVFENMRQDYMKLDNRFTIKPASRAWIVSMDAVWNPSGLSRWRENLTFDNRWDLRIGALNDIRHNYHRSGLHGYGAHLPLVFRFDLPASTADGKLCWRGSVYWPTADGRYEKLSHDRLNCRDLAASFGTTPVTLYASDFDLKHPLSMRLEGTGFYDYTPFMKQFFGVSGALATLILLGSIRIAGLLAVVGSVATIIYVLARRATHAQNPSGLSSMVYMQRGNDGLAHYGFGRDILTAALEGRGDVPISVEIRGAGIAG